MTRREALAAMAGAAGVAALPAVPTPAEPGWVHFRGPALPPPVITVVMTAADIRFAERAMLAQRPIGQVR